MPSPSLLRRPSRVQGALLAAAAFSLVSLLVLLQVYYGGFGGRITHSSNEPSPSPEPAPLWRRDTQEYVLNPSWDTTAPPQERYYNWTLTEISGNPDGRLIAHALVLVRIPRKLTSPTPGVWRTLLAINSQFPGPLVEANEGDTLVVDVHNHMANSTALHWHGFPQNGTNFMDGTVGVTGCAVPPGASFRYRFAAAGLRGTYWYHAHFSTQRVDGLFGPLVVHSPKEAGDGAPTGADYASDRVVMVQDYYHDLSAALLPAYLAPGRENAEPVPNGALINGRNTADCSKVPARYRCDASGAAVEVLNLERDKAHRLRFINVGAFAEFDVELDGHAIVLVEVDGVDVAPYRINRFRINVAQRYSVVIPARSSGGERQGKTEKGTKAGASFWLRARMVVHCFAEIPPALEAEVKAIVQYISPPSPPSPPPPQIPTTTGWNESPELECKEMNLTEVVPAEPVDAPATADSLIYIRSNFEIGSYQLSRGFFNKTSWRPAETPTLLSAVAGVSSGNTSFTANETGSVLDHAYDPRRQLVVSIPRGRAVDLLVDNFDDGNHPFHLHGHKFWVLGQGNGYFDVDTHYKTVQTRNPLRRDTVTVEAFGWVLIRFVADNPGMWAMHCSCPGPPSTQASPG